VHEGIRPSLVGLFVDVAVTQDNIVCIFIAFFSFNFTLYNGLENWSSAMHSVVKYLNT